MRPRPCGFLTDRGGAAAVEFALAVLPLMLTVVGVIQLGRFAWAVQAIEATATASARCLGLRGTSCASSSSPSIALTQAFAVSRARSWSITLVPSQVTVATATTCGGTGAMSQVTIAYTFAAGSGLVPALTSVPVSATACFPNIS